MTFPAAEQLERIAQKSASEYAAANPFPHIVVDGLFSAGILDDVLEEFPKISDGSFNWKRYNNSFERKLATSGNDWGEKTQALLDYMNSPVFLRFLERLTGINGLLPDPSFVGGGIHQIPPGGYLKIHVDFNKHPETKMDRRLNVLLYLNKLWKDEYGGHLELWDDKDWKCQKKIAPLFNRMAVFSTTDYSYHGHPEPLTVPQGMTRKSLALYYYSKGRPEYEINPRLRSHGTLYRLRPGEKISIRSPRDLAMKVIQDLLSRLRVKKKLHE